MFSYPYSLSLAERDIGLARKCAFKLAYIEFQPLNREEGKRIMTQTSIALALPLSDLLRDGFFSKDRDTYLPSIFARTASWSPPNSSSKFRNVTSTSGMSKSSLQEISSQTPRSCIFWDHNYNNQSTELKVHLKDWRTIEANQYQI